MNLQSVPLSLPAGGIDPASSIVPGLPRRPIW